MIRRLVVAPLLAALALGACKRQDMAAQEKYQAWDRDDFFPQQSTMRPLVRGTVARDAPDPPAPQPATIDAALLDRGEQRFEIFCAPCHGRAGDGEGMIVQRGFPHPPSFHIPRLRQAKAAQLYDTITNGHGAMYSYADRVNAADRWAVVAYIRALQISQDADAATLTAGDRAHLGAGR